MNQIRSLPDKAGHVPIHRGVSAGSQQERKVFIQRCKEAISLLVEEGYLLAKSQQDLHKTFTPAETERYGNYRVLESYLHTMGDPKLGKKDFDQLRGYVLEILIPLEKAYWQERLTQCDHYYSQDKLALGTRGKRYLHASLGVLRKDVDHSSTLQDFQKLKGKLDKALQDTKAITDRGGFTYGRTNWSLFLKHVEDEWEAIQRHGINKDLAAQLGGKSGDSEAIDTLLAQCRAIVISPTHRGKGSLPLLYAKLNKLMQPYFLMYWDNKLDSAIKFMKDPDTAMDPELKKSRVHFLGLLRKTFKERADDKDRFTLQDAFDIRWAFSRLMDRRATREGIAKVMRETAARERRWEIGGKISEGIAKHGAVGAGGALVIAGTTAVAVALGAPVVVAGVATSTLIAGGVMLIGAGVGAGVAVEEQHREGHDATFINTSIGMAQGALDVLPGAGLITSPLKMSAVMFGANNAMAVAGQIHNDPRSLEEAVTDWKGLGTTMAITTAMTLGPMALGSAVGGRLKNPKARYEGTGLEPPATLQDLDHISGAPLPDLPEEALVDQLDGIFPHDDIPPAPSVVSSPAGSGGNTPGTSSGGVPPAGTDAPPVGQAGTSASPPPPPPRPLPPPPPPPRGPAEPSTARPAPQPSPPPPVSPEEVAMTRHILETLPSNNLNTVETFARGHGQPVYLFDLDNGQWRLRARNAIWEPNSDGSWRQTQVPLPPDATPVATFDPSAGTEPVWQIRTGARPSTAPRPAAPAEAAAPAAPGETSAPGPRAVLPDPETTDPQAGRALEPERTPTDPVGFENTAPEPVAPPVQRQRFPLRQEAGLAPQPATQPQTLDELRQLGSVYIYNQVTGRYALVYTGETIRGTERVREFLVYVLSPNDRVSYPQSDGEAGTLLRALTAPHRRSGYIEPSRNYVGFLPRAESDVAPPFGRGATSRPSAPPRPPRASAEPSAPASVPRTVPSKNEAFQILSGEYPGVRIKRQWHVHEEIAVVENGPTFFYDVQEGRWVEVIGFQGLANQTGQAVKVAQFGPRETGRKLAVITNPVTGRNQFFSYRFSERRWVEVRGPRDTFDTVERYTPVEEGVPHPSALQPRPRGIQVPAGEVLPEVSPGWAVTQAHLDLIPHSARSRNLNAELFDIGNGQARLRMGNDVYEPNANGGWDLIPKDRGGDAVIPSGLEPLATFNPSDNEWNAAPDLEITANDIPVLAAGQSEGTSGASGVRASSRADTTPEITLEEDVTPGALERPHPLSPESTPTSGRRRSSLTPEERAAALQETLFPGLEGPEAIPAPTQASSPALGVADDPASAVKTSPSVRVADNDDIAPSQGDELTGALEDVSPPADGGAEVTSRTPTVNEWSAGNQEHTARTPPEVHVALGRAPTTPASAPRPEAVPSNLPAAAEAVPPSPPAMATAGQTPQTDIASTVFGSRGEKKTISLNAQRKVELSWGSLEGGGDYRTMTINFDVMHRIMRQINARTGSQWHLVSSENTTSAKMWAIVDGEQADRSGLSMFQTTNGEGRWNTPLVSSTPSNSAQEEVVRRFWTEVCTELNALIQ